MPARFFDDAAEEQARLNAEPTVNTIDEATAGRVMSIHRQAKQLPADAKVALARAGFDGDSDVVQLAAQGNIQRKAKKKGFGLHSFGDLVAAAGEGIQDAAGFAGNIVKDTARVGFTALAAPLEEIQGVARAGIKTVADGGSFGRNLSQAGGSTARLALGDLLSGDRVELGDGFFQGGELAKEQEVLARRLKVNGQWISLGRAAADIITEPGSGAYKVLSGLVDGVVAVAADPASWATAGLAKTQKARKLLVVSEPGKLARLAEAAGMVSGRRPQVLEDVFEAFATGDDATKVFNAVAGITSRSQIWRMTGRKLPARMVDQLAVTSSPDEVRDLFKAEVLAGKIREKPELVKVRPSMDRVRLLQQMPGRFVDPQDADEVLTTAERFMRNAKVGDDVIDARLDSIIEKAGQAGGDRANRISMWNEVNEMMGDTMAHLAGPGAEGQARKLTKMWSSYSDSLAKFYTDDIGNNVPVLGAVLDGNRLPLPTPHLITEMIDGAIPLPDARAIRRVTSAYGRMLNKPGLDLGVAALDFLANDVWKPLVLLRGAWTVRVIGEEQVRMGAAGLESMFRHPMSYLAYVAANDESKVAGLLRKAGVKERGGIGPAGAKFTASDEFRSAMSNRSGPWRDNVRKVGRRNVRSDEEEFVASWADELLRVEGDDVGRRVLRGLGEGDRTPNAREGLEGVKGWWRDGTGRGIREELATAKNRSALRDDVVEMDRYIDSVQDRLTVKTAGGDPELLDFLRNGKIRNPDGTASPELLDVLGRLRDEGRSPSTVVGDINISLRGSQGGKVAEGLDRGVEFMFTHLMSKRTNELSRSPVFSQFAWQRTGEIIGQADEVAQQKILANARAANLPKKQLDSLEATIKRGSGDLSFDEVDHVAKGFGLDETRKLLYDLSDRSQFFDVFRLIFPFGEAWKEILTTWTRVGLTEGGGRPLRRVQQIVEGARGSGFFYTDPASGEEMFNYPGSAALNEFFTGIPVPLAGRAQGLNLFSASVIPGVGPVVQIGMSKVLPNKPEWDWARTLVSPFGDPDFSGGVLESQLPPWAQKMRRFFSDPESDRMFAGTVADVARYLVSTGEYSRTPEDIDRLEADSITKARRLFVIRGAAQFVSPSAPVWQEIAQVSDKAAESLRKEHPDLFDPDKAFHPLGSGGRVAAQFLLDDFHQMQERDYETAPFAFLDKYGDDALMFMQPKSRSLVGKSPATAAGNDWIREHGDLVDRYPQVYGFFAPDDGERDFTAMARQFEAGEREALTPRQQIQLANSRVGNMIYRQAKNRAGTSDEGATWLRQVRQSLVKEYPGFGISLGLTEKAEFPQVLDQWRRIAEEPAVTDTDQGKALRLYLAARDKAQASAVAMGLAGFGSAKSARPIRDWLRSITEQITARFPEFGEMFDVSLSREITADDEETDG